MNSIKRYSVSELLEVYFNGCWFVRDDADKYGPTVKVFTDSVVHYALKLSIGNASEYYGGPCNVLYRVVVEGVPCSPYCFDHVICRECGRKGGKYA